MSVKTLLKLQALSSLLHRLRRFTPGWVTTPLEKKSA